MGYKVKNENLEVELRLKKRLEEFGLVIDFDEDNILLENDDKNKKSDKKEE